MNYKDAQKQLSTRIIWPIAVGYFQDSQVIAAWCELRQSYRHFRLDRIISYEVLSDNLPYPKSYLFSRWKKESLKEAPDKN
ncbi:MULTISPECIES: helix-turn-helix transcriptional regulator [Proteus]|uniref:helix-turn-helix transcriptional regulator n=1 Tax=Proteus TaxID=583 RepID=UPI003F6857E7